MRWLFVLFKFAYKDFLEDRQFKNLSNSSIQDYRNTFIQFQEFLTTNQIVNIEDVNEKTVKEYLKYCQSERDNKPSSINHKLRNLKTLFNYLGEQQIINSKNNPCTKLSYLKEDIKIETFNEYHIQQMLNYYRRMKGRDKSFYAFRDYVVIITLLGSGIRSGELRNLKWKDIDFANSTMTIFGKVRIQRTIPIVNKLRRELSEWKLYKDQQLQTQQLDHYVITTSTNEVLTKNALRGIFKRLSTMMNFKDVRVSPHTFRHTFAKQYIMNGADAFSLQTILGHATLEMTLKYVKLFGTNLVDKNNKFNPLNHIDI